LLSPHRLMSVGITFTNADSTSTGEYVTFPDCIHAQYDTMRSDR
jgi:hypothetical protein